MPWNSGGTIRGDIRLTVELELGLASNPGHKGGRNSGSDRQLASPRGTTANEAAAWHRNPLAAVRPGLQASAANAAWARRALDQHDEGHRGRRHAAPTPVENADPLSETEHASR